MDDTPSVAACGDRDAPQAAEVDPPVDDAELDDPEEDGVEVDGELVEEDEVDSLGVLLEDPELSELEDVPRESLR